MYTYPGLQTKSRALDNSNLIAFSSQLPGLRSLIYFLCFAMNEERSFPIQVGELYDVVMLNIHQCLLQI